MNRKLIYVFGVSVLGLFLELCLIRWLPSQVRALSYFKNLVLISSFFGFSLGFLINRRLQHFINLFPILLLIEIALAIVLSNFRIVDTSNIDEHLWLLYFDLPTSAPSFPLTVALPIFYLSNTLTFIPVGQLLATAMEDVADSLLAYITNVVGSIVGTLLFVFVSFLEFGPLAWFLPTLVILAGLLWEIGNRRVALATISTAIVLLVLPLAQPYAMWSPYYVIQAAPLPLQPNSMSGSGLAKPESPRTSESGFTVSVNGSFHQQALNFSTAARAAYTTLGAFYRLYSIPYDGYLTDVLHRRPGEVLVVGAGTGNDVAIALAHGAEHIDAVEIDPVILRLGRELRPDPVYDDPRVHSHVNDARQYLQTIDRKYDLIIFGTLDSQIALSALSTIRLDNYVYTVQSIEQAKQALKPDGILVLYFWAEKDWIKSRLVGMVEQAFGHPPQVATVDTPSLFNTVIIASADPAAPQVAAWQEQTQRLRQAARSQEIPTDDWPYLYQRERGLSQFYLIEILVLILLSGGALVLICSPLLGGTRESLARLHAPLFLQGMGFLLLETRSISVLSLLYGGTWVVNAIVIAAILALILVANLSVRRFHVQKLMVPFLGLAATLCLGFVFPISVLLGQGVLTRTIGSIFIYLTPIFFSSLIFAVLLRDAQDLRQAYSSNLLGAVIGGFGEYIASLTGLRMLSLIALIVFVPIVFLRRNLHPATLLEEPEATSGHHSSG
jgi:spermidine synthase